MAPYPVRVSRLIALLDWLQQQPGLENIDCKESFHSEIPFYRTKVKLKKEIVTMGVEGIDPKNGQLAPM